jgi:hypothetical protein
LKQRLIDRGSDKINAHNLTASKLSGLESPV